jgi:orotidine-5'-phosphate decarboxylase
MTFLETLIGTWHKNNSLLCVGLDPDLEKIPDHLRSLKSPLFEFNRLIIDLTADLVCAYKPQIAFYAASGLERDLEKTIAYIHDQHRGIPVILDAKRGDIGSTAGLYAREVFDRYGADAVTVNPYLGGDALDPFFNRRDKGVIILCRTSNPGATDIQDLEVKGEKLYRVVARKAAQEWNRNGNVLLVVGATWGNTGPGGEHAFAGARYRCPGRGHRKSGDQWEDPGRNRDDHQFLPGDHLCRSGKGFRPGCQSSGPPAQRANQ